MSGTLKHGAHRFTGSVNATTANVDYQALVVCYDAYPGNPASTSATSTAGSSYDPSATQVVQANLILGTTLTGQATNYNEFGFKQINGAGSTVNDISVVFSATSVLNTAFVPINMAVASGATVPGTGAGTLAVNTGAALPWTLTPGDSIVVYSKHTSSGQYTGMVAGTVNIQAFQS